MSELLERYGASLMNAFGPPKLALVRGEGAHVWDDQGREYVDFLGGIAVNTLGHAHPALVEALSTQVRTLGHVSNFFTSPQQVALAERLVALMTPADVEARVFFSNSGAEANEAALKLTRLTGRSHVVAMQDAFHGRTMGSLALTSKAAYREPFEPLPGHVTWVPFGDVEALAAAVTDETAAVVIEPLQGEAGVNEAPAAYLAAAREVTERHGALLWFDEVQSGMGRTGTWLASQASGVVPDLVTLAKGLGGGMPIGATLGLGRAATLFEPGNHGTTFGGNPLSCATALAVLDTIERDGLLARAVEVGERLRSGLAEDPRVTDVRGLGVLVGLTLAEEKASAVVAAAQEAGWIINATGPDRVRLAPPLVVTDDDVAGFLAAWPGLLDAAGLAGGVGSP
ncbi:acetylornithine transaminase [Nocardioides aurantiacus]|uniref:Acetylornithine aminotransferase n=1 Tax=Nocardioides aurantiacus TaxID=86796 RepID=A0A3N2CUI7_9ACTN|nr:acetylornithine transaminase [Nocardioides aurantiacus]ROR91197.1 acetylornithine aminotransferase [Nocardioides aurantiacus]